MRQKLPAVIRMVEENCTNCHQCIAVCPVKYCNDGSGDTVKINHDLCIGCGHCVDACIKSHNGSEEKAARRYVDDAEAMLEGLATGNLVALVAPSAQCNFDLPRLISALKTLGFAAVYDVSLGGEITVACYHHLIEEGKLKPPVIAQPCPAIVTYIELYHPRLIPYLAPVGSPVYNAAVYARKFHPECRMAFISPCLAKRREFSDNGLIDFNVTFRSLERILAERDICLERLEPGTFDNEVQAGIAAGFPSPGGLKGTYLHHYPGTPPRSITRVEGSIVYDKYLPDLERAVEEGSSRLPLIVDILSCGRGCNLGPGCINHHRSIDDIERAVGLRAEENVEATRGELDAFLADLDYALYDYHYYKDLSGNQTIKTPSSEEISGIFAAMLKEEDKDFRNCGACGYGSCYGMAVAIYNGLNKAQNCHLYQEKALRYDQDRFQSIAREISSAFADVQGSVNELSSTSGITFDYYNAVIESIDSIRHISTEMADKAENLAPVVKTISSIAKTLQEQLNLLQQMIDAMPTPIFFRDNEGVFQGCNKAFEEIVGRPRSKIVGRHISKVLPRDLTEKYMELDADLTGNPEMQFYEAEFEFADGNRHAFVFNQAPFRSIDGEPLGVVGITVDITDHKRMEQEVLRLDRLRVVGELAAGLAHEIRNPMTTVRGFLQMLREEPIMAAYKGYYDMMIEELDSANGIIAEFLSLAKDKTVDLQLLSLNSIIEALTPLLGAEALKHDNSISIIPGDIPDLLLDARQIRQLILNLARNGLEAMNPGGALTISTYMVGDEVAMEIRDQGPGIDPEILAHLGTPFFTTKDQGTGLGLAVCYSIAARHNARIEVQTSSEGTSFIVRFGNKREEANAHA